jgi:hypothetical protein
MWFIARMWSSGVFLGDTFQLLAYSSRFDHFFSLRKVFRYDYHHDHWIR